MVELIPLYPKAVEGALSGEQKEMLWGGSSYLRPWLNYPRNVPLRVTELRMLLIRSRVFDTTSGLLAPSRKPGLRGR